MGNGVLTGKSCVCQSCTRKSLGKVTQNNVETSITLWNGGRDKSDERTDKLTRLTKD